MHTPPDIEQCYRRYAPMVYRRCRQLLKDPDLAYDALQDTFVQLARASGTLDSRALSALLNRIATHVALNRLRKERGLGAAESSDDLLTQLACGRDLEGTTAAGRLLARLFSTELESTRVMAVLHLHDGLTLEETAQEMGMSVSGVRKRLRKLKALAEQLEVTP